MKEKQLGEFLNEVGFVKNFDFLREKYNVDNPQFKICKDQVLEIFSSLGITPVNKRSYYYYTEKNKSLEFIYSIDLKYGVPLIGTSYKDLNSDVFYGIPSWGYEYNSLTDNLVHGVIGPAIDSYSKLRELIADSYDFHLKIAKIITQFIEKN